MPTWTTAGRPASPINGQAGFNTSLNTTEAYSTSTSTWISIVYPGAGIPNSTGSAWGTSYTTSGSGTVVALTVAPTFTGTATIAAIASSNSITLAANGSTNDPYGSMSVTEPANANNYSYYGLTRAGNLGDGFGLSGTTGAGGLGANAFWFGSATSGTAGVLSGTAWVAFNASSLVASGNVTAYSDERLKTNWQSITNNFVEKLANVKSGIYDRTDVDLTQVGVSAQSLQKILPEAVTEPKDDNGYLTVAYGNAALVSAVELAKELIALKAIVKELKAEIDELKGK